MSLIIGTTSSPSVTGSVPPGRKQFWTSMTSNAVFDCAGIHVLYKMAIVVNNLKYLKTIFQQMIDSFVQLGNNVIFIYGIIDEC
jgi:hypothetical protein